MDGNEYVLLLADIHANFVALQAVLRDVRGRYPTDRCGKLKIWFLGDLFGRGPAPVQVWDWFVDISPEAAVVGNHDWGLIGKHEDIKVQVSRTPPKWIWDGPFNGDDWEIILEHRQQLRITGLVSLDAQGSPIGGELFQQIKTWPVVQVPRPAIYLVHGGSENGLVVTTLLEELPWGYVKKADHAEHTFASLDWLFQNWSERSELQAAPDALQAPKLILVGHFHRRTLYFGDSRHWESPVKLDQPYLLSTRLTRPILISPGGVGFPREEDDYDKEASYAVLFLQNQTPHSIRFHKTAFDRKEVLNQMQQRHYPAKILEYLKTPDEIRSDDVSNNNLPERGLL